LDPASGAGRLVSVVGAGGIGKTRLALHAAARAAREAHPDGAYPDGVWLVELSPLHTIGLVGLAVVEALRLADRSTDPVADVIAEWAEGKKLLLILDSCEHVLADCAELVDALLPAPGPARPGHEDRPAPGPRRQGPAWTLPRQNRGPGWPPPEGPGGGPGRGGAGLDILVTSREPLGMPGERVLRLDPLPVQDDAVTLFADRAAVADPSFVLDEGNRSVAVAVCGRLDGSPLAIELAAARLGEFSLDDLHGRLGERPTSPLDLLTAPGEQGPPRHHALRTAIGWSHELCAPLERLLWARLSVFAGGFCVTAAEDVCAGGPLRAESVADLLDRLVEQSIVLRHRTDPGRLRLLGTVREFGADWLRELDEVEAVRLRHREHYRRLARLGCAEWNTGRQVAWCERVLTEHANLRAAMDCALTEPDSRVALEMAADIGFLWRHCGYLRDAQHCLDLALAVKPAPGPDRTRALWVRGGVALLQGDLSAAADWAARCQVAAREQCDPAATVAAAHITGGQLALSGQLSEAIAVLSSIPRLSAQEDWFGFAADLQVQLSLSFTHLLGGDHERARAVADETRAASVACGESWAGAFADGIMAHVDLARGDVRAAVRTARTALAGHVLMHNTAGAAVALDVLAAAVVAQGDAHRAARLLGIAAHVWELTGRAQLDSPDLLATRRAHELRVRGEIGDAAYERAYEEGRSMAYEQGLDYAATGTA
jgi:predicted ATPase